MRAFESLAPETPARAPALQRMLTAARARTLAHAGDLGGGDVLGPRLSIVNPPLWEIGHLGWFQERWCLRERGTGTLGPSILAGADALYDSSRVAHATRWDLPLPSFEHTLEYLVAVLDRVRDRIAGSDSPELAYFVQLAALHEEMHCEAFTYTRQTLGMRPPPDVPRRERASALARSEDAVFTGGEFMLGATLEDGFVFDNEKWAHPVRIRPFAMARAAVTNAEFAAFVDEGGYQRRAFWSEEGWRWRSAAAAEHPVYWIREQGAWLERRFNEIEPLDPARPVMHVSFFEAEAYGRWAGRRLPTEAEWEYAAAYGPGEKKRRYPWGNAPPDEERANLYGTAGTPVHVTAFGAGDSAQGCRQMIGNVWEWTQDAFLPYPGFTADPYKDYSEPWFGNHKVLRGGCFATRATLIRNTWRNFYTPDRRDVFAGFRTCAL
jgi:iron(II)-dependent oxidoreductase